MKIHIPKEYAKIKVNKKNWFIAKSETNRIKIQLPEPKNEWWIDGYTDYDAYIEVILSDSKKER